MCSWLPIRLTNASAGTGGWLISQSTTCALSVAAIHVVAEMDQRGMFGRPGGDVFGDHLVQGDEAVEAAVDVADGVDALSGGQGGGGGGEFDHDHCRA